MSVIVQRIIAFYFSVIMAFNVLFGLNNTTKSYSPPTGGAESLETNCLYENYNLPVFEGGKLQGIYESSDETIIGRYEKTSLEDFQNYVELLSSSGFVIYDKNTIENNRFTTMISNDTSVNVSWFIRTQTMRIIAEPRKYLCPLYDAAEGEYETLLTGMKGETVIAGEGMGYIIRLSDGRFCIVDGGMGDPDHIDSDKLMNILLAQKPNDVEKPVIAAWIFTHLHGDHIGVFNCFSIDHHSDVIIENLYFNFPKEEEIKKSDSPYMLDDSIYRYTQFKKCLNEYYSDVSVVKLHSGNRFVAGNARFEVLYAYDDLYPLTILDGGMNEDSLLIKMMIEGQTILWTGDIAFNATDLVISEYRDALSTDFLQMAHHGMNGTKEFYSLVNPKYALLPVWEGGLSEMLWKKQNLVLVANKNLRQFIVTSCGTWTIRLPYFEIPSEKDRIPTENTIYPSYPNLLG